jgi:hypothetical protein
MAESLSGQKHLTVYLLGAGASYPSLPLARGVSDGMIDWADKVNEYAKGVSVVQERSNHETLASELRFWGIAASSHYTVDTLAKKLFLQNRRDDLWRLKAAMSAYFMLQQSLSTIEQRYDSFFAAILERPGNPPTFPTNVWLFTWNYDRLLERAYHQFCPDVRKVQDQITFSDRVVRLNGLLGRAIDKGTGDEYNLNFSTDPGTTFDRVTKEYVELRAREPIISFAFEQSASPLESIESLKATVCTLVVIGYSFPFFNRRYDKIILNAFPTIDRAYLQVLPQHAKSVETRIRTLRALPHLELVDDADQFYVPYDTEKDI